MWPISTSSIPTRRPRVSIQGRSSTASALNSKDIIEGVCYDPRIGNQYNNPSFGYGGYCFPKDTKQLLANFEGVPQNLIEAIVKANDTRKDYIGKAIFNKVCTPSPRIGIYRLAMKSGSDNFRKSAILDIINELKKYFLSFYIYEPTINDVEFEGCTVVKDLDEFKRECDIIIANRYSEELDDVKKKVYTRDIFNNN